ncbi:MAG: hypothetical protein HDR88_10025 [Bacteroides sp.]|nr:hypothetical protein [Bacteroides sp.]
MGFFSRWKRRKSKATANQKPIAEFSVTIYPDKAVFSIYGDEDKIGGALATLMLNNQYSHRIVTNAVIVAEKERERQRAFSDLMIMNLN